MHEETNPPPPSGYSNDQKHGPVTGQATGRMEEEREREQERVRERERDDERRPIMGRPSKR